MFEKTRLLNLSMAEFEATMIRSSMDVAFDCFDTGAVRTPQVLLPDPNPVSIIKQQSFYH